MIVINPSTRQFNIPGAEMTFGVEADSGSERKYFQCPRYVGNKLDIASSFVRINYRNANGEVDSYLVEDLEIDGDNVTFSWELYPKVTAYKGQIRFVMCVVGPDTKVAWHTTLGTGVVLEGLEPDYAVIQAGTADVVAQLIALVDKQTTAVENKGAEWVRNVQSEGTDQVIAVQTAAQTAQAASVAEIEAKGVNTRESIPEDYTALSEAVDTLNRTRGAAIVCEASGETVVVSDASDLPMRGLRVFGKTTQVKTIGKNLLKNTASTKTAYGVTYTSNPDGSVRITGTATAASTYEVDFNTPIDYQGENLILSLGGAVSGVTVRLGYFKEDNTILDTLVVVGQTEKEFTYPTEAIATRTYFTVAEGVTYNVTVYPMVRRASVTDATYEPYTGGKPSPSPDFPQELVSLEPVVAVYGKNLLKNEAVTQTLNGVTFTVNYKDGSFTAKGTASGATFFGIDYDVKNIVPGKVYCLTGCPAGGSGSTYRLYAQTNDGQTFAGDVGAGTRFTGTDAQWQVLFVVYKDTVVDLTVYPMLRLASVADTTFEPYKTLQTVELTHTLPGIPVTSGGNYTDSDGQQWICDEVDLERGVYVQRCNVVEFDGTNHSFYTGQHTNGQLYIGISDFDIARDTTVISSHYKSSIWSNSNGEVYCSNDVVIATDNRFTTVSKAKEYLGENPVTFAYILETPVEKSLSETEIAAYRALHSNYPNTTVLNDAGAHMVVKYAADTKLYIDNKIAALIGG